MTRIVRFAVVGGLGFLADAGMLALLTAEGHVGPLAARLASILFAICVTWALNRRLTFGPSNRGVAAEGMRYGGVGLGTSVVNYLVYSALILAIPGLSPLVALAGGSFVAMLLSYFGYSKLVFDA